MIMGSVNNLNPNINTTIRVFDEFYDFDIEVDSNEYDIVYSYFASVFKTKEAAKNFATALFRVADQTGTPVLTLLNQMQDQDSIQLTATLAYYLNGLRSPTTLLGINGSVVPNYYTARNVLP